MAILDSIRNNLNRLFGTSPSNGIVLKWNNGQLALYDAKLGTFIDEGYLSNEQVYAIIRWIIRKSTKIPFYLYEVTDEKALKQYKNLTSNEGTNKASLVSAGVIRQKALVEVEQDHPLKQWLERPNPYQRWDEFVEYCVGYKLIAGERFLQSIIGLTSKSPEVFPLNPIDVTVKRGEHLFEAAGYLYGPLREALDKETIVHSKYFNPSQIGVGESIRGLSPLRAMLGVLQESNDGKKQSIKQMQNAGPVGAIYGKSGKEDEMMPVSVADKLEDKITKAWVTGQKRPIVTAGPIDFVRFGLSPTELGIMENRKFSFRQLCDGYGLPIEVFNMGDGTTFNNKNEAKRSAIIDAVLPEIYSLRNDINELLKVYLTGGTKKYFIDCDPSDLPELQEDMKEMVEVYSRLIDKSAISPNEFRVAMKWGKDERPEVARLMDYPMVASGLTPWLDLAESDPLDIDPNDQTDIPN